MFLVPDGHKSMPWVIWHSNNNHYSVSCFPYKCIVASDTLICINTSSRLFSWKNGKIGYRINDYLSFYYVGVTALITDLTIETMPSLRVLLLYFTHDCINCLQWCYTASKHHIAPLQCLIESTSSLNTSSKQIVNVEKCYVIIIIIPSKQTDDVITQTSKIMQEINYQKPDHLLFSHWLYTNYQLTIASNTPVIIVIISILLLFSVSM